MSCNTCNKPVTVCCCPKPAPVPVPVPEPTCLNPIVVLLDEANDCFKDQPCQNQNCESPVKVWLTSVITNSPQNPVENPEIFQEYFTSILQGGIVMSNQGLCCSQCCEDKAYILAGVDGKTLDTYFDGGGTVNCCANFIGPMQMQSDLIDFYNLYNISPYPNKCDNNFEVCVAHLAANTDNMNSLIAMGIFETVGGLGQSEICNIVDVMLSAGFTPTMIHDTFERLLTNGLVTSCANGQIYIGGVEGYNDFIKIYGRLVEGGGKA